MLGLGRYLLGALEILLLAGFSGLGATAVRRRLVPELSGAPSLLSSLVLAAALLILVAEALGTFGAWSWRPTSAAWAFWVLERGRCSGGWRRLRGAENGPLARPQAPLKRCQDPPAAA